MVTNPVTVALEVRREVLRLLREDVQPTPEIRERVLFIADHFMTSADITTLKGERVARWSADVSVPAYGLTPTWYSGMAQGHVVEVLLAARKLSGREKYLRVARDGANLLRHGITEGGVAVPLAGGLWFEEYAKAGAPHPLVLNGHIFALEALHALATVDSSYADLLAQGLAALRTQLPKYDKGVWSAYDQLGIPANYSYQTIHAKQLRLLHDWTGDPLFKEYEQRFRRQMLVPLGPFYRICVYPTRALAILLLGNALLVAGAAATLASLRPWRRAKAG